MKNENGITLVALVVTVILMGILMAFLIKASTFKGLLNEKNKVEQDFNEVLNQTDEKIYSIREQWEDVI